MHKFTRRLRKSRERRAINERNCGTGEPRHSGGAGGAHLYPVRDGCHESGQARRSLWDRLARERGKYADYDAVKAKAEQFDAAQEADKSELQRALERATELQTQVDAMNRANAVRAVRDKVSAATGVPAGLLSGESEEDCTAQAQAILEFARPGYPSVRDGGEADARRREQQDDGVMAAFRQLNPKLEV